MVSFSDEIAGVESWDDMEGVPPPRANSQLFGHGSALAQFESKVCEGKIHHAWLIGGPRGIGKASFAYSAAAKLFAATSDLDETAIRSKFANSAHPNMLHLSRPRDEKTGKFKSVLSVDEIRRTVSFFGKTAGEGTWRVCIVDSADDMNTSAANALLKILEEPPAKTVFFVLANSPGRLLPTIRSRCRYLPLRPLDDKNLADALGNINQQPKEKFDILSRLSGGSVRRAILLQHHGGLDLHEKFDTLMNKSEPDWVSAHKLVEDLARANRQEQYDLFLDIAHDYVAGKIADLATASIRYNPRTLQPIDGLARMIKVWEKTSQEANLARQYNLDKKQVILNLFGAYHRAAN